MWCFRLSTLVGPISTLGGGSSTGRGGVVGGLSTVVEVNVRSISRYSGADRQTGVLRSGRRGCRAKWSAHDRNRHAAERGDTTIEPIADRPRVRTPPSAPV